jgi:prophage antirepressor-like protein
MTNNNNEINETNEISAPQTFFYNDNEVRTVWENGQLCWIAKDICKVFGETNRNRAMRSLSEDEKGYTYVYTPLGLQKLAIVNESGLYSLLFAMQPSKAGLPYKYSKMRKIH